MWGVKINDKYWLAPTSGPGKFFYLSRKEVFPFRSEEGARELVGSYLRKEYTENTNIEFIRQK